MSGSPWYRLALSIILLAVMVMVWTPRLDELYYHSLAKTKLTDIGDATQWSEKAESVPENSYVSVSGILGNKAATLRGLRTGSLRFGRYQVRHLLGSKLYIEYLEEKYHPIFNPFTRVSVKGRLASFGPDSNSQKVRKFFEEHYGKAVDDQAMLIVVDEEPRGEYIYLALFILSLALVITSFYFSVRGFMLKPRREEPEV